jgi:hypothetical protein
MIASDDDVDLGSASGSECPLLLRKAADLIPAEPKPPSHKREALVTTFDTLPNELGVFMVLTESGTTHLLSNEGWRYMWERRPPEGTVKGAHDFERIRITSLDGWRVGECGFLWVADETYLTGATWHRTARIVSITRDE